MLSHLALDFFALVISLDIPFKHGISLFQGLQVLAVCSQKLDSDVNAN